MLARAWCLHAQPFEVEALQHTLGEQVTNDDFALLPRYLQCADLDAGLAGTLYLKHFHPHLLVGVRPTFCPTASACVHRVWSRPGPGAYVIGGSRRRRRTTAACPVSFLISHPLTASPVMGACCNLANGALCFVCCLVSLYDISL